MPVRRGRALAVLGSLVAVAGLAIAWAASREAGKPSPPPLPPGAVAVDVWVPYWTLEHTLPLAGQRLADVREASPFWYGARGVESIVTDEHANAARTAEFVEAIGRSPAALVPSIRDEIDAGGMAAILADPRTRTRHVQAIVEFAETNDVAGIDLDYEQFAFADGRATWEATRPAWVAFVEELAAALHADGRTLTITIPPVYDDGRTDDSGYWVYDHAAIAAHADAIRIMGYDYSVAEPGPIAPLDWVRTLVEGVSATVPEEYHHKLVLGVPAYGYNWVVDVFGTCPTTAEGRTNVPVRGVDDLRERRGGTPVYDPGFGEWSFEYNLLVEGTDADGGTTSCTQVREVRWVGADGVADRVEIARRAGWGGVGLWALGYDDTAAWEALIRTAHDPMPAATVP